jgi:hypothetical protein
MVALNSPIAIHDEYITLVRSTDVSLALTVDDEPTADDYEKLRQHTHAFFVLLLKKVFPEQFVELKLELGVTDFGAEKPEPKYNVYVEWDIQATFTSSSSSSLLSSPTSVDGNNINAPVDSKDKVPSPSEMCKALLTDVDYFDYLVSSVRTIEDSVFSEATAVAAEQRKGALVY